MKFFKKLTMEDNLNNAIFSTLKPVCDSLVLGSNQNSIEDLNCLLSKLPAPGIQNFQSYIIFPIEIQLHKTSLMHQKQMLVDLLAKLMSLTYIESSSLLFRLSTVLCQQVVVRDNLTKVGDVPEELKLSVVECLIQLWRSSMSDVWFDALSRDNYPRLSPVVFMLVQLAKSEKLIKLRVAALECLLVLCYTHDSADMADVEMRQKARSVVMLMLPGIVSCCVGIAAEPKTQNHKVTVANIQLWSRVVSLVMEDKEPAEKQDPSSPGSTSAPSSTHERVHQLQRQVRTVEWLQRTADRLTAVTEAMLRAQTHSHWQVRCELVKASHLLLTSCPRNMALTVGSLVCCLVVLSEDELQEVRGPSQRALTELSLEFELDTGQSLLQLVEAAFYHLLLRAPRIMQGTDESSQTTCLNLLVGYLRLQGTKLPQVLCSASFLHRLLVTLLHVSHLDSSNISLLEECSIREVESNQVVRESWKQLKYCNTVQKLRRLQDVCCVLRDYADLHTITHALVDMLDSNPEHTKEVILLLNLILAGGGAESMTGQTELVKTVVNLFLQPRLWDVPLSVTQPDDTAASSVPEAQSNIVQVSLLAEGLGLLALSVGQHFSLCLLRCLYPLLECAGSPLRPLATAGLTAVQNVAQACVGGGVTELVCANVDYLSHHITLRLRRAHHNPGVLSVLSVVMRHTTIQVLPSLHEIVEDVLVQSCDDFQEFNANGFLRVFLTFLQCMRGWQQWETEQAQKETTAQQKTILKELLLYKMCKETAENLETEEPIEEELNEEMFKTNKIRDGEEYMVEEEAEDKPKEVAPSIKLTVAVLERSLHFLPSKDEQRQILVLDILLEGVLVLRREEDQLLPVVHKMWSPLVNRFQAAATRPLVMHRAFLLLCTLGTTARDFIRNRTLKQVLPALCRTLEDSSLQSQLKDSGHAYRLTQQYKLQRALLGGLGRLAIDLTLQEKELHQLLVAATPYLSTRQPLPLQELCCQLYQEVSSVHPDLVWLFLISVWSPVSHVEPPFTSLPPHLPVIQLDSCSDETSEFKRNVSELLQWIGS